MKKNNKNKAHKITMSYLFISNDKKINLSKDNCDTKEFKRFLEQLKKEQLNGILLTEMSSDNHIIFVARYLLKNGDCEVINYDNKL